MQRTFWGRRRRRRVSVNRQATRVRRWSPVKNLYDNNKSMIRSLFCRTTHCEHGMRLWHLCLSVRSFVRPSVTLGIVICVGGALKRIVKLLGQISETKLSNVSWHRQCREIATDQLIWQYLGNDAIHVCMLMLPQTTNRKTKHDLSTVTGIVSRASILRNTR